MAASNGSTTALNIYIRSDVYISGEELLDEIVKKIEVNRENVHVQTLSGYWQFYFELTAAKDSEIRHIYNNRHSLPQSWSVQYRGIREDAVVVKITAFAADVVNSSHQGAGYNFLKSLKEQQYFNYEVLLVLKVVNLATENYLYLHQCDDQNDILQPILKVDIAPLNPSKPGNDVQLVVEDLNKICETIGKHWKGYRILLKAEAKDLDLAPGSTIILTSTEKVNLPKT